MISISISNIKYQSIDMVYQSNSLIFDWFLHDKLKNISKNFRLRRKWISISNIKYQCSSKLISISISNINVIKKLISISISNIKYQSIDLIYQYFWLIWYINRTSLNAFVNTVVCVPCVGPASCTGCNYFLCKSMKKYELSLIDF